MMLLFQNDPNKDIHVNDELRNIRTARLVKAIMSSEELASIDMRNAMSELITDMIYICAEEKMRIDDIVDDAKGNYHDETDDESIYD